MVRKIMRQIRSGHARVCLHRNSLTQHPPRSASWNPNTSLRASRPRTLSRPSDSLHTQSRMRFARM
jgi:hypothetical protein